MTETQIIEWLSALLNVFYVVFAAQGRRFCWLFGIAGAAGYVYINLVSGLYMDTLLQSFYILAGIAGWFSWKSDFPSAITYTTLRKREYVYAIPVLLIASYGLSRLVALLPGSSLPVADSVITLFSFYATWLTVRKAIENWWWWIAIDLAAVLMYWIKGLEVTSALYLFYTATAVWGWYNWKKNGVPFSHEQH